MGAPEHEIRDSPIPVADLAAGSAVLVRGGSMSGKYDLLLRLLAALADRGVLVSTSRQVQRARRDFSVYGDPERLGVVDCASKVQGGTAEESALVRYAASPRNLTDIGVKFTDLAGAMRDDGLDGAVGVHSVSELLVYWDVDRVYQFLRVLLAECGETDWPAVAVVDDDAADEQVVTTLTQPFDAVISTRVDDDGRALRYHEPGREPSDWAAF